MNRTNEALENLEILYYEIMSVKANKFLFKDEKEQKITQIKNYINQRNYLSINNLNN